MSLVTTAMLSLATALLAVPCGPGCGAGTCDEHRAVCECPIGFDGPHCERPTLPACMLDEHLIPVRSWVLNAFHDNQGRKRWPGEGPHPIGPVPCQCLEQFVAAPFLLERTRLQYMRGCASGIR